MQIAAVLLALLAGLVTAAASPAIVLASTPNSEGYDGGYFYKWWTDGSGQATYINQGSGKYTATWSGSNGTFFGGKGWNPGTLNRVINYSGTYQPSGNSYLSVYGWAQNTLIEYYIIESYGSYNPASAFQKMGTASCNGGTYDILLARRTLPNAVMRQFYSIRTPKKPPVGAISGTVDVGCHFDAWRAVGMDVGSNLSFQIMAVEGYYSSGTATITVS